MYHCFNSQRTLQKLEEFDRVMLLPYLTYSLDLFVNQWHTSILDVTFPMLRRYKKIDASFFLLLNQRNGTCKRSKTLPDNSRKRSITKDYTLHIKYLYIFWCGFFLVMVRILVVTFSDECKLEGVTSHQYVRRRLGRRQERIIIEDRRTVKHPPVMIIWPCICCENSGSLNFIERTIHKVE